MEVSFFLSFDNECLGCVYTQGRSLGCGDILWGAFWLITPMAGQIEFSYETAAILLVVRHMVDLCRCLCRHDHSVIDLGQIQWYKNGEVKALDRRVELCALQVGGLHLVVLLPRDVVLVPYLLLGLGCSRSSAE